MEGAYSVTTWVVYMFSIRLHLSSLVRSLDVTLNDIVKGLGIVCELFFTLLRTYISYTISEVNYMSKLKSEWFGWIKALLIAFALAFVVRMFFFAPIVVDGTSMMPTLHNHDQMIVNKFIYDISEPDRFDIIVFHATPEQDFIKRVIGFPGEQVAVKDEVLYIDGEPIKEPFLQEAKEQMTPNQTLTADFQLEDIPGGYETIPEGYVLVLGDNRNNSADSRVLGLIREDTIVGKTKLIYWPLNRIQILGE